MAKSVVLSKTCYSICAGSLNKKISLLTRVLTPPQGGDFDYTEVLSEIASVYSMIETPKSVTVFNGVDLSSGASITQPTHIFYIRYRTGITNETFISYAGNYYDILKFTNLDEQNKFLKLEAILSGSTSSAASKASSVT